MRGGDSAALNVLSSEWGCRLRFSYCWEWAQAMIPGRRVEVHWRGSHPVAWAYGPGSHDSTFVKGAPQRDWNKWADLCLCNQLSNVLLKSLRGVWICQAIFGFCDIRNFTDATEVLQERGKGGSFKWKADASSTKLHFWICYWYVHIFSYIWEKSGTGFSRANRLSRLPFEWPECLSAAAWRRGSGDGLCEPHRICDSFVRQWILWESEQEHRSRAKHQQEYVFAQFISISIYIYIYQAFWVVFQAENLVL